MQEEQREKDKYLQKTFKVMGLAVMLPSSILGLFFFLKKLEEKNLISSWVTLFLLILYVVGLLIIMVKNGTKSKN
jgi:FtsH-binding integral membrane protein